MPKQSFKQRYHTDPAFRYAQLKRVYARCLRSGAVKEPSHEKLEQFGLHALAQELGLKVRSPPKAPSALQAPQVSSSMLDRWRRNPLDIALEPGAEAQ